jgi:5'-nucleotidase
MRILVSNDDGVYAPGIKSLASHLKEVAPVVVVAPDRDKSAVSHSLTIDMPVRVVPLEDGRYSVHGTPTDSVHLALTGVLDELPTMVVSGINAGANMGDDTLYSGTVAAAMEGCLLGLPAIAISLVGQKEADLIHYDTAARVAVTLVKKLMKNPLPKGLLLNVNVPDIPYEQLQGMKMTRLGQRHAAERPLVIIDPRGKPVYWMGPAGDEKDAGEGTDFFAVRNNCVSITPLQFDLTDHKALKDMASWI